MENKNIKPAFSVIIPTLNEEHHVPYLLSDLRDQTFKDFEVIIVDGKSEDKTQQKASVFKDKFRKFTFLTSDIRNVSYQRNKGSKAAKADWLVFMDADTRIPPYFFQGIKFRVEMNRPDILSTWIKADTNNKKDQAAAYLASLYMDLQKTNSQPSILESLLCIRKSVFLRLQGFNENIHWGEGSDLMKRAVRMKVKYVFLREPRYTFSFRRLRKQGSLSMLRKIAELELNRLVGTKVPEKRIKNLYPMEGGTYFELDSSDEGRVEKFFTKFINATRNQIKNGNSKIVKGFFNKIFG